MQQKLPKDEDAVEIDETLDEEGQRKKDAVLDAL